VATGKIKRCKDCHTPISKANAYIDKGDRVRARCKACDKIYRNKQHSLDAFSYMDKIYSKGKYEVKTGRRKNRADLTWHINQGHLYHLYNKQQGKCNFCAVTMTWETGQSWRNHNISIDRIKNDVGYEPNNIQLLCYRCNVMKHNLQEEEFFEYVERIYLHILARNKQ
jgi:5-methylcytosine-specific restriction endonuclease McrA